MTQPHEVNVTREEACQVLDRLTMFYPPEAIDAVKEEIAKIIAARVPDAKKPDDGNGDEDVENRGHNALRAAVLRGPQ